MKNTDEKPLCFLIVHGFGGSVQEVIPLAERLEKGGYYCVLPSLAGHEEKGKRLKNAPWQHWLASVRAHYYRLAKDYQVVAVGFSMGGLLTAMLNRERPFAAMVFINTPIYFWNLPQVAKNLATDFSKTAHYYFIDSAGRTTPHAMREFLRLLVTAKSYFSFVHCPALVVQAANDDSVWPQSGRYIYRHVMGKRQFYQPAGGSHQVLLNPTECEGIVVEILEFLRTNRL